MALPDAANKKIHATECRDVDVFGDDGGEQVKLHRWPSFVCIRHKQVCSYLTSWLMKADKYWPENMEGMNKLFVSGIDETLQSVHII